VFVDISENETFKARTLSIVHHARNSPSRGNVERRRVSRPKRTIRPQARGPRGVIISRVSRTTDFQVCPHVAVFKYQRRSKNKPPGTGRTGAQGQLYTYTGAVHGTRRITRKRTTRTTFQTHSDRTWIVNPRSGGG